jgi:uncharacterized phiE125 gp8 family phage protein
MRILSRTAVSSATPSATDLALHLRLEAAEAVSADRYAAAAMQEIEKHAGLALLHTTIVCLSAPVPGANLRLPVGPLAADPQALVYLVAEDGSETQTSAFRLIGGNAPELILATPPAWQVRITYRAGFGATIGDVPPDLLHAALDQALVLYEERGDVDKPRLSAAAARISARYRRVVIA